MDPMWAQVTVTMVLVAITAYYAYQVRKSNESIWKLEEKKRKHKKIELRRAIAGEVLMNILILDQIAHEIEKLKEIDSIDSELSSIEFPEIIAYRNIIGDIGILGEEEITTIMELYLTLREIKIEYMKIKLALETGSLNRQILDDISKKLEFTIDYSETLEKSYNKLFKGEIDENQLKEILKDI